MTVVVSDRGKGVLDASAGDQEDVPESVDSDGFWVGVRRWRRDEVTPPPGGAPRATPRRPAGRRAQHPPPSPRAAPSPSPPRRRVRGSAARPRSRQFAPVGHGAPSRCIKSHTESWRDERATTIVGV